MSQLTSLFINVLFVLLLCVFVDTFVNDAISLSVFNLISRQKIIAYDKPARLEVAVVLGAL